MTIIIAEQHAHPVDLNAAALADAVPDDVSGYAVQVAPLVFAFSAGIFTGTVLVAGAMGTAATVYGIGYVAGAVNGDGKTNEEKPARGS